MLVGIDPDYTERVTVRGATFTVRRIPHGKWARLRQEAVDAYAQAQRKAIATLAERGEDPDEQTDPKVKDSPKKVTLTAMASPQYKETMAALEAESVRLGVIGHEGFAKPDGTAVPFETETLTFEGEPLVVVGRPTMRWYRANPAILTLLHNALWRINELEPAEKKG